MKTLLRRHWSIWLFGCVVMMWQSPAYAVRSYSVALVSPAPAEFDMGTTMTGVFRVTNTGNQDTITKLRFRLNNGDHFAAGITPPAGWTVTLSSASGGGYNTVTFTATSTANGIPIGGFRDFSIPIMFRTLSSDATQKLRDVRATFTSGTGGNTTVTVSGQPSWTLKSLIVTLTPSSLSVARSCVGSFTLTMQVINRSTSGLTNVTSVPKPPTLNVLSGGVTATTTSNPPNLTLNTGASGTMVWTYNTGPNTGTLSFTASAASGARTSRTITSPVITVTATSCLIADFNATPPAPACIFSGDTVTFTMRVTNNTGVTLSNLVPSALTRGGTATIGTITGPTPASVASLANGAVTTFSWTAPVTGSVFDTYTLSGSVTATGGYLSQTTTTVVADLNGFVLNAAPDVTAYSTNQEMTWAITNHGCNSVKSVAIPVPAGWTFSGDTYSLVDLGAGTTTENWTASVSGSTVTFTAPAGSEIAVDAPASSFNLTLSTPTVAATTTYPFSATVTDTNATPRVRTITDPILLTVAPFNTGSPSPNRTTPGPWRELFP